MATVMIPATTPEQLADRAMGVELMAIEVAERLEWAEAQGRTDDAEILTVQLHDVLGQLADIAERLPSAA